MAGMVKQRRLDPTWPYSLGKYVCGPAETAQEPGYGHIRWDMRHLGVACGGAKAAKAWAVKYPHLSREEFFAVYRPGKRSRADEHICGPLSEVGEPGEAHYQYDVKYRDEACGKALGQLARTKPPYVGLPRDEFLAMYVPKAQRGQYICGEAHDVDVPGPGHAVRDRRRGGACEKAKALETWWRYYPNHTKNEFLEAYMDGYDVLHTLYRFSFLDGDVYYGITKREVEARFSDHLKYDTLLGRKLRAGVPYILETMCTFPNRGMALAVEALCIQSGNPWGEMLNVQHNPEKAVI